MDYFFVHNFFFHIIGFISLIWLLPFFCSFYVISLYLPTYGMSDLDLFVTFFSLCISVPTSEVLRYFATRPSFVKDYGTFFEGVGYIQVIWILPYYGAFYFVTSELPTYNMSIPTLLDMLFSAMISVSISIVLHFVFGIRR